MRLLIAFAAWLAVSQVTVLGGDGQYVLRIAHLGYDNRPLGDAQPVEKETDAVELLVKPETPFAVVARLADTKITITGVLQKADNALATLDYAYSRQTETKALRASSIIEIKLGQCTTLSERSGETPETRDGKSTMVQFGEKVTCELTNAADAKAKFKGYEAPQASKTPYGSLDYAPSSARH